MQKVETNIIDQTWPENELENINACPYCNGSQRTLAYESVQDWSFYCAPGKWTYWNCNSCEALYLSPRPTATSIGKAYAKYYTHTTGVDSFASRLKNLLKNECFFHWLGADFSPRLHIPAIFAFVLSPIKKRMYIPFDIESLVKLKKGTLLDVGCGSGNKLHQAKQLGWDVTGLEIDPNAVKAARESGLNVIQGDFRQLEQLEDKFDCIICSHVVEHVHEPTELLTLITKALKPQGTFILSLPNATSHVRESFGENWRGLEAPRHLGIPSLQKMIDYLKYLNYHDIKQINIYNSTIAESARIRSSRFGNKIHADDSKTASDDCFGEYASDFIQIIAKK